MTLLLAAGGGATGARTLRRSQDSASSKAPSPDALLEIQAEIVAIRQKVSELRVDAANAHHTLREYIQRRNELTAQLEATIESRRNAQVQVSQISKRQLSEIKSMLRSPPDSVRRTLIACWILLHSDRFRGKSSVQVNEAKDWPRVQKMLADSDFIPGILEFKTDALVELPHVSRHVASEFFNVQIGGDELMGSAAIPPSVLSNAGRTILPATGRSRSEPCQGRTGSSRSPIMRSSTRGSALGKKSSPAPKPPLNVDMVTNASEPCGALARWMLELMRELFEVKRIEKERVEVEAAITEADRLVARLEGEIAEAEASISKQCAVAEEMERLLTIARTAPQAEERKPQPAPQVKEKRQEPAPPIQPRSKPKPTPVPPSPPPQNVEVELMGSMAYIDRALAAFRIPFPGQNEVQVLTGDAQQAKLLPELAETVRSSKGVKVLIEGHCEDDEEDGVDIERSLAVYDWLVSFAGIPPGFLRIAGIGSKEGLGRCAQPVPIHEVAPRAGPVPKDVRESPKAKPGLYFEHSSAAIVEETRAILVSMAEFLNMEDDITVRIEGHCDDHEPEGLGLRRSCAVRDFLEGRGVRRSRLKPKSCKHMFPLSRTNQAMNRRVELHAI